MAKKTGKPMERQVKAEVVKKSRQAPGTTIESRENQIIRLAYDLVEQRIKKGTATSQEVTEFIKMGSSKAQLEKARLEKENELLEAKREALQSQKNIEQLYEKAIAAYKTYRGEGEDNQNDDYDD